MTATRLAGKALGDFLKIAGASIASGVERKVLSGLAGAAEHVDAPGLLGAIARHPETTAKLAGAVAPALVGGGVAAGAAGINQLMTPRENVYAQSQYSLPMQRQGTPVAYSNQQYMPGISPMTNQTAAEALLEQQKFQHQLRLIEARQAAQQGVGIGGRTSGGLDIMGLSQQVFAPTSY
jgi:hypothetical protein